ncbi:hypothetical protein MCOR27_011210 [Pyricularia oryzae]|uniref:Uncharacterized protein n=5 Tax=Pyricularia TaxID=48558 RepID=A0ABQ8N2W5_PYRGI|nr:uncharacterized protein MGG_04198 [Pyricularia oryzae 70-15]ELQ38413.1 hypothetical protein OOU_Y34scaffold00540g18 [Pyricularia oryzae Y34]KAH8845756.1 hypothetical protein MCOR01_002989 [Pyricularia oryzae]KAI6290003.1 hypothetical protein MCOR33_011585 [Pyricularia grisea]EHA47257.1 hypothetical protein MGG_04198 [Pyricularia oryzae 70-15]KAH9432739.1 hypothetical protein MCOR02_007419 [Pyricularia oryzae]
MAQGTVKMSAKSSQPTKNKGTMKKGARVFKPKKSNQSTKADKIVKKYTSGLVGQTEKLLGERAGHLELIGKGRTKNKDAAGSNKTGGSKKFG